MSNIERNSGDVVVAAVQMTSSASLENNLLIAAHWVREAAKQGAKIIVLPEYFCIMGYSEKDKLVVAESHGCGKIQSWLAALAIECEIWLVGGSIPVASEYESKPFSRCYVFSPQGEAVAWYDKIHLFDVQVDDLTRQYHESRYCTAGSRVVAFETPWGRVGLAICYDLRFPELFRQLSKQDVNIFLVPAAFTRKTGIAHWQVLLKARAIENLAYVVASAQAGKHENGRETYGHSMVITPWGDELAQKTSGAGFVIARLDLVAQRKVRNQFPVLTHTRL